MNHLQHLLLKLSEECNEVGQMAAKCMQFGLLEVREDLLENNKMRLHAELDDLNAIITMLNASYNFDYTPNPKAISKKINKVEKYLIRSVDLDMVDMNVPENQWKESNND